MSENTTIARPYAQALFDSADVAGELALWSERLAAMARVAADPDMRACIANPKLTAQQLIELFLELCRQDGEPVRNLVRVLVENRRLALLPEIRALFEQLKNQREGVLDARVFSAFPLDEAQKDVLIADLEHKFKRRVTASVEVDPELIGGVKVVIGDQVIDASVRARLAAMAAALKG